MEIHSGYALDSSLLAGIPHGGFGHARILIVGDLMLDRYILGDVTRISPEAPVPVLTVSGERTVAGGAANVALNVAGLNAKAIVAGVVGDDLSGRHLKELLGASGVSTSAVVTDSGRPTTCKTRVMCDNHQIVRMDEESCQALKSTVVDQLSTAILPLLNQGIDAVILSDYAKGVLGCAFTEHVISECRARAIPVLVDPKRADYSPYAGAALVTPNLKEFKTATVAMSIQEQDLSKAGSILRGRLNANALLVTQGANGMTLFTGEHSHHFPALAEEVFDVSGAGDTVISTIATALAGGLDLLTAVKLSNIAAGIVVRRSGTAPISWDDLRRSLFAEHSLLEHKNAEPTRMSRTAVG